MKLLIITQKIDVNDDNLGFFVRWVEEFARHAKEVFVIANFTGEYNLPKNVMVFSLGKEAGLGRVRRYFNFYKYLFQILPKTDAVFAHMIPMWVLMSWPLATIFRKKIYLWYTHKSVPFSLRIAEKLVEKIFTASDKSFRLPSEKVMVMGHGIDIDKFKNQKSKIKIANQNSKLKIITAGRISPSKNLDVLIEAAGILKKEGVDFEMKIAGAPITEEDKKYFEKLKKLAGEGEIKGGVIFVGPISYKEIEKFYQNGDLFINLSSTGSMDKAVLEAMACGLNILTSNEAFFEILPEENMVRELSAGALAQKIKNIKDRVPSPIFRETVIKNHGLENLINRICSEFT